MIEGQEKTIGREELLKHISKFIEKKIGWLKLQPGFSGKEIWDASVNSGEVGEQFKTRCVETARLVLSKIDSINSDKDYLKIRPFLSRSSVRGRDKFVIKNEREFEGWILSILIKEQPTNPALIGEIVLKPGLYSKEDFFKLVNSIMSRGVVNPGLWVEEFVATKYFPNGATEVSIADLEAEISEFILEKQEKVEKN